MKMDYFAVMLLVLIGLAIVLLFLLVRLGLFRTAFVFGLAVIVYLFFLMQSPPRKVITIEDLPKRQGSARTCVNG